MLYIFDSTEKLITTLPKDSFFNAVHREVLNGENTFQFTLPAGSEYVVEGNLVAFRDQDSYWQIFEIKRLVDTHGDGLTRTAYCEHIFYELLDDIVTDRRPSADATAALAGMLDNTRWQVGIVDDLGASSTSAYYESALSAVQKVANAWKGELNWRCVIAGGVITRYVDLLAMRGIDTGKQFAYSKDILSIEREVDTSEVVTALYGRGKGVETESGAYGRRLTFADVEAPGKPLGQEWIGDNDALARWGRPGGRHRFDVFIDEEETDPAKLLQKTRDELDRRKVPRVTYRLDVVSLEELTGYEHEKVRLGDLVRVIDREFKPELVVSARVVEIERDLLDPANTKVVLGSFAPTIVEATINTARRVNEMANKPYNTKWLDGKISVLQNAIENTKSYVFQTPEDGILFLDAPTYEQATQAMKLGGGKFAIANQKDGQGGWNWRTFGDGSGFTADLITAGRIDAGLVQIGPETTFAPGYDPTLIDPSASATMGVDSDCLGLWHFDGSLNSHKGVAADSDGAFGDGCFGQALSIATGKKLKVPTTDMLAGEGVINFRAENLSASSNGSVLIDLPDNVGNQGIFCGIADDGKLFIEDAKLQFQSVETSQADFQTGTLVDVVATSAGNLELAKDGTDVTYTETSQADFQTGTLVDVVATSAGNLELATGKALGTREKVVDLSSVGANNSGSIINFTKTDAVVTNATFTRASVAYLEDGTEVDAGAPRFEQGKFGKAVLVEEGTENLFTNPRLLNNGSGWIPTSATAWVNSSGEYPYIHCEAQWDGVIQILSLSATTYTLTCLVKHKAGSNTIGSHFDGLPSMKIRVDRGAWVVNSNIITVPSDGNWHLVEIQATYTTAGSYRVYLQPGRGVVGVSEFWFKYAQLEQKPYATSFVDGTRSPETLTIPTAGVLNPQEGTIALWFKPYPAFWNGSYNRIIGHATAGNINELSLARLSTEDKLICYASDASGQWSGGSYSALSSTTELEPNKWYHLAFTWKTGGKLVLYVNGVKEGEIDYDKPPSVFGTLAVGYHPNYSGRHADGLYDELRIDKVCRTDEEIAAWYNSGGPIPFQSGCTYKMDFDNNLQATVGTVNVEVALSVDGGDNYGQYSEVKSGLPIPGLAPDTDLTNGRLKIKETLYTSDVTVTPQLHSLDFTIYYETYKSSGYRYKVYDISAVGSVGSSKISWTENTPASTTLTVKAAVSTDGGTTYGSFQNCTSGSAIPVLTQGMDISNARLKVQEDLTTSDGTKTPQLQSLIIDVGSNVQTAYGPNKSTLTAWDSISLAWKPERLSLVVNDEEACYIDNPGLPASLGSHIYIGTDRNGANAINTLVDELRIDKVYREVNIRAGWHKTGVPFYTSEDMKQWPGYLRAETDGWKVYDSFGNLRGVMGSWMYEAIRKYGIKIIEGLILATEIRTGAEGAKTYIALKPAPSNAFEMWSEINGVSTKTFSITSAAGSETARFDFYKGGQWAGYVGLSVDNQITLLPLLVNPTTGLKENWLGGDKTEVGGDLYVNGSMSCGGAKPATQTTENYGLRYMYAVESPELKYYDSGVANLQNGEATIYIDPIFLECIEPDTELTPWQIWVQCYGENDVYVSEIGEDYFKIKEKNGGTSNNKVVWKHEAIRKGYAGIRLMEVTN